MGHYLAPVQRTGYLVKHATVEATIESTAAGFDHVAPGDPSGLRYPDLAGII